MVEATVGRLSAVVESSKSGRGVADIEGIFEGEDYPGNKVVSGREERQERLRGEY